MSLLDTLRKLGIVRFGTKAATYRNATERPTEFMMDNVCNAEKEVINLDAPAKAAPTPPTKPQAAVGASGATSCWKCGATLPPDAKFCGRCGMPQAAHPAASGVCPKCGAGLKPDAKFCGSCGAPVAGVPPATVATAAPLKSSPKMKGCLIGGLIGFALLVVLLVVLAIIGSQSEDSKQPANSEPAPAAATPAAAAAHGGRTPAPTPPPATPPAPVQPPASSVNDRFKPTAPATPATPPTMPAPPPATPSADYVTGAATTSPPAAAGAVRYDRYANPKFGFVTELPAHWESEVRDNTHLFSGPKGSEDYHVTINFQFIAMTAPGQVARQKQDALGQLQRLEGFRLIEDNVYQLQDQYPAGFLHACYKLPGNDTLWEQIQIIIERPPYYYFIGYTSPQPLFEKYYPHLQRLIRTLRFTPLSQ